MAFILGGLFFGVSLLAHRIQPYPSHDQTVFSQMGLLVFGSGPLYLILQFATAAILTLAANTAYADFPRLSSIIAADGYLPKQLANRGDRLVFSNGVLVLAVTASALIVGFGGKTSALIRSMRSACSPRSLFRRPAWWCTIAKRKSRVGSAIWCSTVSGHSPPLLCS